MNSTVKFYAILGAIIVGCLALGRVTKADTTFISGTIHFNTTWTPAGNPYMVVGGTRVDTNVILTIEPGVIVKLNPLISLTIDGGLDARGTPSDSIIFTEKAGLWGRLAFSGSSMDSICSLQYCRIEKCGYDIRFRGASPVIESCNISNNGCTNSSDCNTALVIESGSRVRILNSTISYNASRNYCCGGAIWIQAGSSPEIRGNLIVGNYAYASGWGNGNNGGGICVSSDSAIIVGNTITDNSTYATTTTARGGGIAVLNCSPLIVCNEIMNNSAELGGGIYVQAGYPIIAGNTITGNSAYDGSGSYLVNAGGIYCYWLLSKGIFALNNIHDNHDFVNSLFEVHSGYGSDQLIMENNWWGTTNPTEIDLLVYDFWDNPALEEIDFIPFSEDVNVPPIDSIVVVSPNGGEQLLSFNIDTIRWNPFCFTDDVRIEYSTDGGSNWELIADSTRNFGIYFWEVPYALSTTCRIRVFDAADSIPSDMSDNDFTICVGPTIQLTYPNGGEVLSADSSYDIMWNSYCFDSSVKIEYSTNGGADWITIVADTANIGSIAWTAPDTTSLNCRVKVSDALDGDPFDISDDDFSVYICGDIDASGAVNVADLTYLVDYMFFEGPPPPVMEAANVDGEGGINVADLIYLVDYIFFEGPEPICGPIE